MAQQLSVKEPTAQQIAEQKIYKQMGVTDEEFEQNLSDFSDVSRTIVKLVFSVLCGRSIALIKIPSRCFANSRLQVLAF